tara:strand:- start:173 stop:1312 length:1140 start_codon:yes stop_codon:yes gene_type:complete
MIKKINILEPYLENNEKINLINCLKKNEISTFGRYIPLLEKEASKLTKCKYSIAVSSGSSGLLMSFKTIKKFNKNEIIITQSYTFTATTNSIWHSGFQPMLFDIDKKTLSLDVNKLENYFKKNTFQKNGLVYDKKNKKRISAVCLVLTFSILADVKKFSQICKKYRLKLIIDAACALTINNNKIKLNDYADIVIYSLNGNKSLTSGGGGIVCCKNKNDFKKIKLLSTNAKVDKLPYTYSDFGFNNRMTNLHAAIGYAQLKKFKNIIKKKSIIQKQYKENLKGNNYYSYPSIKGLFWLNFIIFKKTIYIKKAIKNLRKYKINVNFFWKPMHLQSYKSQFIIQNQELTNQLWNKVLVLPSSLNLEENQIKFISKVINKMKI